MPQQLPLTPPDFYGMYPETVVGLTHQADQCVGQVYNAGQYGNYDVNRQATTRKPGSTLAPQLPNNLGKENERCSSIGMIASSHTMMDGSSSATVSVLPPIHVPDWSRVELRQQQLGSGAPAPPFKEEKATGGVAVHLDYEMEQMAEYVAEMTQGMYDLYESHICLADIDILRSVNPKVLVASAFRKYVLQVLSSTRLPSSTILLGLHYLATRMSLLPSGGRYPQGKGQIYRMLTTALLLGSKFLDDNTFQNRSWSEVSNIPVSELNDLEIDWLIAIGWNLHIDPEDTQGFTLWRTHWQRWQAKCLEMSIESLKLTALDVNGHRLQQTPKTQQTLASTYSPVHNQKNCNNIRANSRTIPQLRVPGYDRWPSFQAKTDYSPPSAPETGPTTPEWYGGLADYEYNCLSEPSSTNTIHPVSQHSYPSYIQAPYSTQYPQPWLTKKWNGHPISCKCTGCLPSPERYLIGSGYRLQSVFG
ncbi:MAG: hypothetical protein L6R41_003752 [Letrouitia leprolyta]|nr:MAG: hypothetical protein L6R41_003752 [Letrouitia leprolyta]